MRTAGGAIEDGEAMALSDAREETPYAPPEWEAGIEEALADLREGRYEEFNDIEALIARLNP